MRHLPWFTMACRHPRQLKQLGGHGAVNSGRGSAVPWLVRTASGRPLPRIARWTLRTGHRPRTGDASEGKGQRDSLAFHLTLNIRNTRREILAGKTFAEKIPLREPFCPNFLIIFLDKLLSQPAREKSIGLHEALEIFDFVSPPI